MIESELEERFTQLVLDDYFEDELLNISGTI
jgi:hypothetical protein